MQSVVNVAQSWPRGPGGSRPVGSGTSRSRPWQGWDLFAGAILLVWPFLQLWAASWESRLRGALGIESPSVGPIAALLVWSMVLPFFTLVIGASAVAEKRLGGWFLLGVGLLLYPPFLSGLMGVYGI